MYLCAKTKAMDIRKYAMMVVALLCCSAAVARPMVSPNGKLSIEVKDGQLVIAYQGKQVLQMSYNKNLGDLEESCHSQKQMRFIRVLRANGCGNRY